MTDRLTKPEMVNAIAAAFAEAGISSKRTRIGRDVICRVGNPTDVHALRRVGAHRASAILIQMTAADKEEEEASEDVKNGATLRSILALRVVLHCSTDYERSQSSWDDLRIVAQLASPSKAIQVAHMGEATDGRPFLSPQVLSIFMNSLLFTCAVQPGIGFTLLSMLSFEGKALRTRRVKDFPDRGAHLIGLTMKEAAIVWEDGILIGVVRDDCHIQPGTFLKGEGFAPDASRVITADDRVMFLCGTSRPRLATKTLPKIVEQATQNWCSSQSPICLLVCGWKKEWEDAEGFAFQICSTASEMPPGSHLIFLCKKEGWTEFMEQVTAEDPLIAASTEPNSKAYYYNNVKITHYYGDGAVYSNLAEVLQKHPVDKVVIMSTTVTSLSQEASEVSKDTRVLTVMLFLRHLQVELMNDRPVQVIGENSMDSTSLIAVAPTARQGEPPDFVNVHAIYACALAQGLAYPRLQPSIMQLFDTTAGSPSLMMKDSMEYIPQGSWRFGSIVQMFKEKVPNDILVGIREVSGNILLVPDLHETCRVEPGMLLILISRRLTQAQLSQHAQLSARKESKRKHEHEDSGDKATKDVMMTSGLALHQDLPGQTISSVLGE
eukprot:TRINITY_DN18868_c1_g1_i1.p1 TRINITY_DN18868_c1_g1~~TRINITY_DN18868_c1_g1_i1.p1  ORF type:complete len:621 (+),score=96.90 TRINITY_DN18868_c1_g1_i1:44-1864(+)